MADADAQIVTGLPLMATLVNRTDMADVNAGYLGKLGGCSLLQTAYLKGGRRAKGMVEAVLLRSCPCGTTLAGRCIARALSSRHLYHLVLARPRRPPRNPAHLLRVMIDAPPCG